MNEKIISILRKYSDVPDMHGSQLLTVDDKSVYGDQVLHLACVKGDLDDVKILLQSNADINARGEKGFTPLHYAVEQRRIEVVEYLLSVGADPCIINDNGDTAQDLAELLEYDEILSSLKPYLDEQ